MGFVLFVFYLFLFLTLSFFENTKIGPFYDVYLHNPGPAVSLFFILSGFVLELAYFSKFSPRISAKDYRSFLRRRLTKIYPFYLLMQLAWIAFSFSTRGDASFAEWAIPTLKKLPLAIFLLQSIIPSFYFSHAFNSAAWFLSTLFILYLIAPILFHFLDKMHRLWKMLFLFFSVLAIFVPVFYGLSELQTFLNGLQLSITFEDVTYGWPPLRFFEFFLGAISGRIFLLLKTQNKSLPKKQFTILEIVTALTIFVFTFIENALNLPTVVEDLLTSLIGCVLVVIFAFDGGSLSHFLSAKPLNILGSASFEMYLFHYELRWIPYIYFLSWLGQSLTRLTLFSLIIFAVTISGSLTFVTIRKNLFFESRKIEHSLIAFSRPAHLKSA